MRFILGIIFCGHDLFWIDGLQTDFV